LRAGEIVDHGRIDVQSAPVLFQCLCSNSPHFYYAHRAFLPCHRRASEGLSWI